MSYTYKVKNEILHRGELTVDEKYAEIRAILLLKHAINENSIELKLENKEIAERIYSMLKDLTQLKIFIKFTKSKKFGEHNTYVITIPSQPGVKKFIDMLNLYTSVGDEINENIQKGFIRGMFLGCGYIKSPEKEYALDFFVDSDELANELYDLLLRMEKRVYKTVKRNKPLVYMRNAEDIMDIIVLIGSMKEFYNYEETTMIKDLKNKTIREMNWEVANETKTLDTARKQIKMINYIGYKIGLNELSPVLEEIAFLRLENQEASLQELAEIIGISKSGIRNRFRRLEEIHNELLEKERES
ncbi:MULTISPECIES: DNA-binding protein WhiA [Cetobacterium]|uniref:Probable cell division protein WhiA n=1 Tax=Candidatus Cetobacterium colombiensis TaxID=3073100 RepID=A0ABU4W8E3_9FUSO|nr:DNA-binding protein WhiA [Candidatus Cetobacterium colombiensis]MDX8335317.1 DNA-binding protein WhiA [Candidatus Cetobacterium colombiensis]